MHGWSGPQGRTDISWTLFPGLDMLLCLLILMDLVTLSLTSRGIGSQAPEEELVNEVVLVMGLMSQSKHRSNTHRSELQ